MRYQRIVAAHLIELTWESFGVDAQRWEEWRQAHPKYSVSRPWGIDSLIGEPRPLPGAPPHSGGLRLQVGSTPTGASLDCLSVAAIS